MPGHTSSWASATAAANSVPEGAQRVSPLVAVPELLRKFGQAPGPILARLGLEPGLFDDPSNTIPYVKVGRLLHLCAQRTRCPHFGLLVGEQSGGEALGRIGGFAQHSPDVGSALRGMFLHFHLHNTGAVPMLTVQNGVAVLTYAISHSSGAALAQHHDGAMAVAVNIMRSMCGAEWTPSEVLFCHSKPADITPYLLLFRAPLRFEADRTALVFPTLWLEHPLTRDHAQSQGTDQAQIEELGMKESGDIVARLRRVLRIALTSGTGAREQVAGLLSMHPRTLNRRLEARGTSFKAQMVEARFDIARQLLETTAMPVVEIATTLDYAGASTFSRAFSRWAGMPPAQWRTEAANPRKTHTVQQRRR